MGEPLARGRERQRDWLTEAHLLNTQGAVPDPMGLPVAEFNGLLAIVRQGRLVRSNASDDACRDYVERWLQEQG